MNKITWFERYPKVTWNDEVTYFKTETSAVLHLHLITEKEKMEEQLRELERKISKNLNDNMAVF